MHLYSAHLVLSGIHSLILISVTTKVVVKGCSFTTAATPRVLLQARPHLLLQFLPLQAKDAVDFLIG